MVLRVAVTRAEPEAAATAARVRAMGAEPVMAPLLSIGPVRFDTGLAGVQALLFTSSNGVRAFAAATTARAARVLAVGDATAEAARAAGFADVRSAGGDVKALAALARETLSPDGGALLHISGAHAAGDIVGELKRAGFVAERRVAYEAHAAATLPETLKQPVDVVLFHSGRAAEAFVALGAPNSAAMAAACISQAAADVAAQAKWARLIVAPRPRDPDLLMAALSAGDTPAGASA